MKKNVLSKAACCWLLLLVAWPALSLPESASSVQKIKLLVSHPNDDELVQQYAPLLKRAYDILNIETEFIQVSFARGLQGTNNGTFDADMLRLGAVVEYYDNLLIIDPPLGSLEIRLFCRVGKECNRDVLTKKGTLIALPFGSPFLQAMFPKPVFRVQKVEGLEQIENMFRLKRFDYFVWAKLSGNPQSFLASFDGNSILVKKETIHHVLNKKHAKIGEELSTVLRKLLAEGFADPDN